MSTCISIYTGATSVCMICVYIYYICELVHTVQDRSSTWKKQVTRRQVPRKVRVCSPTRNTVVSVSVGGANKKGLAHRAMINWWQVGDKCSEGRCHHLSCWTNSRESGKVSWVDDSSFEIYPQRQPLTPLYLTRSRPEPVHSFCFQTLREKISIIRKYERMIIFQ